MNYHILNGDALREQLSGKLKGTVNVLRECLMEGPTEGATLDELIKNRAAFIDTYFQDSNSEGYLSFSAPELQTIAEIPANSTVNLWFEDDLFCQVNMWFAFYLLTSANAPKSYFLIRPLSYTPYSFGKMEGIELCQAYSHKVAITDDEANDLAQLWLLFKENKFEAMLEIGEKHQSKLPFLKPVIEANIERFSETLGKPEKLLMEVIEANSEASFGEVFRKFSKKAGIYGFGDLQVKKMMDQLKLAH